MWLRFLDYYTENPCDCRYDHMTLKMLRKAAHTPLELRGRAAEVRGLVPFAHLVAQQLMSDLDPVEATVKKRAGHLLACYNC